MIVRIAGCAGNRLSVQIPYDTTLISALKRVPGSRWEPKDRVWLIPDTQRCADRLLMSLYDTGLFSASDPGLEGQDDTSELHSGCRQEGQDSGADLLRKSKQGAREEGQDSSADLLRKCRQALESRHYSPRTIDAYLPWIGRFLAYSGGRAASALGERQINAFLSHLAVDEGIASSTQNQALAALLFLYRSVLDVPVGELGQVIRAKKPLRLPVVMTREEVKAVLSKLEGDKWLAGKLMYGTGLRLMECLCLRVQDIDFEGHQILVHDGKGAKDRVTMLPESLKEPLRAQLARVKSIHEKDLAEGWGRVAMPESLARKYPNAASDWAWQYLFPQERRWTDHTSGRQGRYHMDPSIMQRVVHEAVLKAASQSAPAATRSGTPSPPTSSRTATTYAPSRSSWATAT